MIQVAFIELPVEERFKIKVDEQETGFHIKRAVEKEGRWEIHKPDGDILKIMPHSREAASLMAAYYHYEQERRALDAGDDGEDDGGS